MKILFVNPPNKPFTNMSILAEPLDLLQIATIVKREYKNTKVLDMDILRLPNNINKYLSKKEQNIIIFVYDYQLPLHTTKTLNNIFEIVGNTKSYATKFIIIGKTASHYYNEFLSAGIDIVIKGEAENRITKIIRNINSDKLQKIAGLYLKGKRAITSENIKKTDYSKLPIPDRSLVDVSKYMETRTMITSRGCNGKCSFCSTPHFFKEWQSKTPNKIIEEIEYLIKTYNTKQIIFLDDNFTVSKKRVLDICYKIIKRNLNIKLGFLSSIKNYDYEMFCLMHKAGFRWVHFGIESGSSKILKLMNKEMDIKRIKEVIKEVQSIGFRVRTSYILDYPNTTVTDLKKTIDLIKQLNNAEIRLHFLVKRIGTPIYEETGKVEDQYIHNNHSKYLDNECTNLIEELLKELDRKEYHLITEDTNWNKLNVEKSSKLVSMTAMKYGVDWHD